MGADKNLSQSEARFKIPSTHPTLESVDTELRQTHLNALERATIVKTINIAKTLGGPV